MEVVFVTEASKIETGFYKVVLEKRFTKKRVRSVTDIRIGRFIPPTNMLSSTPLLPPLLPPPMLLLNLIPSNMELLTNTLEPTSKKWRIKMSMEPLPVPTRPTFLAVATKL